MTRPLRRVSDAAVRATIARHFGSILKALGLDSDSPNLRATPARVADLLMEAAMRRNRAPAMTTFPNASGQELISIRSVPMYCLCPHHFLPFFGVAHVHYIPASRIVGLSKVPRIIDYLCKTPQTQESLTSQIADEFVNGVKPVGVMVVVEATHLCLEMRGARRIGVTTTTTAVRGRVLPHITALSAGEHKEVSHGRSSD